MYITNNDDSENWIDGDNYTIKEFDDALKKKNKEAKDRGDTEPTYHDAVLHLSDDKAQAILVECGPDAGDLVDQMKRLASLNDRKWEIRNTVSMERGGIYPEPLYDPARIHKERPYITVKESDGITTTDETLYEYERDCNVFPAKDGTLNIPGEPPISFNSSEFGREHVHDLMGYLQAKNPVLAQRMAVEENNSKLQYLQASRIPGAQVKEDDPETVHIKDSKADCILSGDNFHNQDFQDYVKAVDQRYKLKGIQVPVTFQYQGKSYTQNMGSGKTGLEYLNRETPDKEALRKLDEQRYTRGDPGDQKYPRVVIEDVGDGNSRFTKGESLHPYAFVEIADDIRDGSDVKISCRALVEPPDKHKIVTVHLDGSGTHRQLRKYAEARPTMHGLRTALESLDSTVRFLPNDKERIDNENMRRSARNAQTKNSVTRDRPHFERYYNESQHEGLTFSELDGDEHARENALYGVVTSPDGSRYPIAPQGASLKDSKTHADSLEEMIDRSTIPQEVAEQVEISRDHPEFWMAQDCNIVKENFGDKTLTTVMYPGFLTSYDRKTRSPDTVITTEPMSLSDENGREETCIAVKDGRITDSITGKNALRRMNDKNKPDPDSDKPRQNSKAEDRDGDNDRGTALLRSER